MKCRFLFPVLAVVLFSVLASATSAEARWVRRSRHAAFRSRSVMRAPVRKAYRADGKTLWNLGKQNGQWPSLP
jgi:hypothetical protein